MSVIRKMFSSRKFWMTLGGVLIALGSVANGSVPAQEGILAALGVIVSYILSQGWVDSQQSRREDY